MAIQLDPSLLCWYDDRVHRLLPLSSDVSFQTGQSAWTVLHEVLVPFQQRSVEQNLNKIARHIVTSMHMLYLFSVGIVKFIDSFFALHKIFIAHSAFFSEYVVK